MHWHESAMGPPSWTPVPPPSASHPSVSSQCTGPECPGEMRNLKNAIRYVLSLHQNHICTDLPPPPTSSEQFLRALRGAVSWAIAFILPLIKLNSQLSHRILIFSRHRHGVWSPQHALPCCILWTLTLISFLLTLEKGLRRTGAKSMLSFWQSPSQIPSYLSKR